MGAATKTKSATVERIVAGTTRAKALNPATDAEFLSIDEAAVLLRVNRNTLYEAAKRGEVPGIVKIGRILRVRRSALLASGGDAA